jgi:hypothetical protein
VRRCRVVSAVLCAGLEGWWGEDAKPVFTVPYLALGRSAHAGGAEMPDRLGWRDVMRSCAVTGR